MFTKSSIYEFLEDLTPEDRKALLTLIDIMKKHPDESFQPNQLEDSLLNTLRSSLEGLRNELTGDV